MNPIFNKYINFLKDKNINLNLSEGYYWMDRMIIKAFDKQGNTYKIGRIFVDENLNLTYKIYKNKPFEIENWSETVKRNKERLEKLEEESINITRKLLEKYKDYQKYICISGGKDSTVVQHIVRQVNPSIQLLFNNTSNESAETYKYIKSQENYRILNPKEGFWQYIKRENFVPSRLARGCCRLYKHNLTVENLDCNQNILLFMGIRNAESNRRKEYLDEHQFDYYPSNWMCGLPIRKWGEIDIWLYIFMKNLEFNDIYRYGYARCGCTICPFRTPHDDVLTNYYFPKQVERFREVQKSSFFAYERWTNINCTVEEFCKLGWKGGKLRDEPTPEVIQEFADYKGINYEVAKKYFNHKCKICNKLVTKSEDVAMNLKLLGRNISSYYCKKHLMEFLEINKKQWKKYVEEFKQQGCNLF